MMNGNIYTNIYQDSIIKYINQTYEIFTKIPKKNNEMNESNEDYLVSILKCSENFRKQLRLLSDNINMLAEKVDNETNNNNNNLNLDQLYDMIYSIEKSWQLCEIFLLNPTNILSIEFTKWLASICYDNIPLDIYLQEFQYSIQPELFHSTDKLGYWELIYQLTLQGNLSAVVNLLQIHSEIISITNNSNLHMKNDIHISQCNKLFEVLLSHPYANFIHVNDEAHTQSSLLHLQFASNITYDFTNWQTRVMKLRKSNLPLFTSIPEIDTIFRILLGDISTINHWSNFKIPSTENHLLQQQQQQQSNSSSNSSWSWGKLAVAKLLYIYPPPLEAKDLSRIIEECMRDSHSNLNTATTNSIIPYISDLEMSYITTLREVMTGNIGSTLKSFYQLSINNNYNNGDDNSIQSSNNIMKLTQLIPLLCTSHLSLLLITGAEKEDLLIPLKDSPNETSFFEEIVLDVAYQLNNLNFSIHVILQYLSICPLRGYQYALTLLPLRSIDSDKEAIELADIIRNELNNPEGASALLIRRGMYWLHHSNRSLFKLSDHDKDTTTTDDGDVEEKLRSKHVEYINSSTLAKALFFFQASNDIIRLEMILECSLNRCMYSVRCCEELFHDLYLYPTMNSLSKGFMRVVNQKESKINYHSKLQLEAALVEADDLLLAINIIDDTIYYNNNYSSIGNKSKYMIINKLYKSLKMYTEAIKCRLALKETDDPIALRDATILLANLIISDICNPTISIRYWLHILELVAWLFNLIIILNNNNSDSEHLKVNPLFTIFTKQQAYSLLIALEQVEGSYGFKHLYNEATFNNTMNNITNVLELSSTITNNNNNINNNNNSNMSNSNDKLQRLRLSLLGILCNSIIKENAELTKHSTTNTMLKPSFVTSDINPSTTTTMPSTSTRKQLLLFQNNKSNSYNKDYVTTKNYKEQQAYEILTGSKLGMM